MGGGGSETEKQTGGGRDRVHGDGGGRGGA